jgi:hypothetical protein
MAALPGVALALALFASEGHALNNGAAHLPPLGWSQWNAFEMNFNASLFREVALNLLGFGRIVAYSETQVPIILANLV